MNGGPRWPPPLWQEKSKGQRFRQGIASTKMICIVAIEKMKNTTTLQYAAALLKGQWTHHSYSTQPGPWMSPCFDIYSSIQFTGLLGGWSSAQQSPNSSTHKWFEPLVEPRKKKPYIWVQYGENEQVSNKRMGIEPTTRSLTLWPIVWHLHKDRQTESELWTTTPTVSQRACVLNA